MKLILENWRRYMNEEISNEMIEAAKESIRGNPHLSKYADSLTADSLTEAGNYIFLRTEDSFGHTKVSHTRESDLPGSKFSNEYLNDEALTNLVIEIMTKAKPSEYQESSYGNKFKWFNIDLKKPIGEDSIVHKSKVKGASSRMFDFREKIGNNKAIPAILGQGLKVIDQDGNEITSAEQADPKGTYHIQQDVPVIDGPLQPTSLVNLIVAEVGKIGGKSLVSLMTVFPGVSEPKAMNKKDYAELGYYFLTGK
tara:strand:- start:348 stop:1106 length:759 start_codon:yes stop_codon:yes gene_type:complete